MKLKINSIKYKVDSNTLTCIVDTEIGYATTKKSLESNFNDEIVKSYLAQKAIFTLLNTSSEEIKDKYYDQMQESHFIMLFNSRIMKNFPTVYQG